MNKESRATNTAERITVLRYITTSVGGLLAGSVIGGIAGGAVGWFLALSYNRRGSSDPSDVPVYVAMGLILLGACAGGVVGFIVGLIYSVRLGRMAKGATDN